jgi:hypothetical protein
MRSRSRRACSNPIFALRAPASSDAWSVSPPRRGASRASVWPGGRSGEQSLAVRLRLDGRRCHDRRTHHSLDGLGGREVDLPLLFLAERDAFAAMLVPTVRRLGSLGVGEDGDRAELVGLRTECGLDADGQFALAGRAGRDRRLEDPGGRRTGDGEDFVGARRAGEDDRHLALGERLVIGEPGQVNDEIGRLAGDQRLVVDKQFGRLREVGQLLAVLVAMILGCAHGAVAAGRRFPVAASRQAEDRYQGGGEQFLLQVVRSVH